MTSRRGLLIQSNRVCTESSEASHGRATNPSTEPAVMVRELDRLAEHLSTGKFSNGKAPNGAAIHDRLARHSCPQQP